MCNNYTLAPCASTVNLSLGYFLISDFGCTRGWETVKTSHWVKKATGAVFQHLKNIITAATAQLKRLLETEYIIIIVTLKCSGWRMCLSIYLLWMISSAFLIKQLTGFPIKWGGVIKTTQELLPKWVIQPLLLNLQGNTPGNCSCESWWTQLNRLEQLGHHFHFRWIHCLTDRSVKCHKTQREADVFTWLICAAVTQK